MVAKGVLLFPQIPPFCDYYEQKQVNLRSTRFDSIKNYISILRGRWGGCGGEREEGGRECRGAQEMKSDAHGGCNFN